MSAYKPTNSSGKLSLFWAAQIRGPGALGKVISLSTKIREKRPALRLSRSGADLQAGKQITEELQLRRDLARYEKQLRAKVAERPETLRAPTK